MQISLRPRTEDTVRRYFEKTDCPEIRRVLPQKAKTVEEALADYRRTLLPGAGSYGRSIYAGDRHVGDVWCYCIDPAATPNAMISCCVFERDLWGRGIASRALRLFLPDAAARYGLRTFGAFTFSANAASVRVLEKTGFRLLEEFVEDGKASKYFQIAIA